MSAAPRRVLVTGVAGFIGSNLAMRLLGEGYEVVGIDDLSQGIIEQVPDGVEFHRCDIRAANIYPLFDDVSAVFHLAAKNCIAYCQADPVAATAINVAGTANVFEAARQAGVPRIVHAESSALYEGVTVFPTNEELTAPQSVYAVTKQAVAELAAAYARMSNISFTGLRYFCVYGPRQDYRRSMPPVMSAFIIKLLRGERPLIYGNGEKRRDFVYVDDVNDFHMHCLKDARTRGGTYNIGSGVDHSINEILREIQQLLGTDVAPLYQPDMPAEAARTCADISRARALGWRPQVTLREGLRRSIEYIREHVVENIAVAV